MEVQCSGQSARRGGAEERCNELYAPAAYVKGVGPLRAEILARLGLRRACDLLFYFPRDYLEITLRRDVASLTDDSVQSIVGSIEYWQTRYTRRGPLTSLTVDAQGGSVEALWFSMPYISGSFAEGRPLILTGKPKKTNGRWQFSHPKLTYLDAGLDLPTQGGTTDPETGEEKYVLPIYSLTEGLSQAQLQRIIRNVLDTLPDLVPEALPEALRLRRNIAPIGEAIRLMHYPSTPEESEYGRRRFAYQELLVLQLALAICRTRRRANMKAPPLPGTAKLDSRIRRLFPFEFTEAQNHAIREISIDMGRPSPMNRLLQGDVGSGKTAVAIYAALQAAANGAQTALMAPTETLARQHYQTLQQLLSGTSTRVAPFFGGQRACDRAVVEEELATGAAHIVVGTQALVCNELKFKRLGLVVIDEQHKFGVRQRALLKGASELEPHYLVMTATPIPRSMTMTFFGDLDVSTMRGGPPNRRPPTTSIVTRKTRASWLEFVKSRVDEGRQAYFVVPRVTEEIVEEEECGAALGSRELDGASEGDIVASTRWTRWESLEKEEGGEARQKAGKTPLRTVDSVYQELSSGIFKNYRIGFLNGRMKAAQKEEIMRSFRSGELQILVATSVIEVGIDVPNATLMTIENADRFGLAQLHQLRGRVTRGEFPGFCGVVPTNEEPNASEDGRKSTRCKKTDGEKKREEANRAEAFERLRVFTESTDGFELAEKDFTARGPGELFGQKQHGSSQLRIANLVKDRELIEGAREDAVEIVQRDPGLSEFEHEALRRQVLARYGKTLDLGDVG